MKIKKILLILLLLTFSSPRFSRGALDLDDSVSDEIFKAFHGVNYLYTAEYKAKLSVKAADGNEREVVYKVRLLEDDKGYVEIISPNKLKMRILKLGDQMSVYVPKLKKRVKLDDAMRKRAFAGSDLSYEDVFTNVNYYKDYNYEFIDKVFNKEIIASEFILKMTAKDESPRYHKIMAKIHDGSKSIFEMEYYNKEDKLIRTMKTLKTESTEMQNNIYLPMKYEIRDMTKGDSVTTVELFFLRHHVEINQECFTDEYLVKGCF